MNTGDVHKNLLGWCEFHENRRIEIHSSLRAVSEFLYLPQLLSDLSQIQYNRSLRITFHHLCKFHEKRRIEGSTSVLGVDKISLTRVP